VHVQLCVSLVHPVLPALLLLQQVLYAAVHHQLVLCLEVLHHGHVLAMPLLHSYRQMLDAAVEHLCSEFVQYSIV
jgi:hypothetical protein